MATVTRRVLDDSAGTILTSSGRLQYQWGLLYNATKDAFYFLRQTSGPTTYQVAKVPFDLASDTLVASSLGLGDTFCCTVNSDYILMAHSTASPSYSRFRVSDETLISGSALTTASPIVSRAKVETTGSNSAVFVFHGATEKIHGTNYERLYYRTYTVSTDTLGTETLIPNINQSGNALDYQILPASFSVGMRNNYVEDRVWMLMGAANSNANYYDASAGTWTDLSVSNWPGQVNGIHLNISGSHKFFRTFGANTVQRQDSWVSGTGTAETVTGVTAGMETFLIADHAAGFCWVLQAFSTTNLRRKKRDTTGTWDSAWTDETVSYTGATGIRTDIQMDAFFMTKSSIDYLVCLVVTNQASGRGLHIARQSLSAPPPTTPRPRLLQKVGT